MKSRINWIMTLHAQSPISLAAKSRTLKFILKFECYRKMVRLLNWAIICWHSISLLGMDNGSFSFGHFLACKSGKLCFTEWRKRSPLVEQATPGFSVDAHDKATDYERNNETMTPCLISSSRCGRFLDETEATICKKMTCSKFVVMS